MYFRCRRGSLILGAGLLAGPASFAAAQTPTCDGIWHYMDVPGNACLDGTQTGLEYVCFGKSDLPAPPNGDPLQRPLLLYFQGGGGCWDAETCDCQNQGSGCTNPKAFILTDHYDRSYGCDGQAFGQCAAKYAQGYVGDIGVEPAFNSATSGFNNETLNPDGTRSGLQFNMAMIPYCTGDAHMGDAEAVYSSGTVTIQAHHRGYRNVTHDLGILRSMFPDPRRVSLWGASAGAYGVDCNLSQTAGAWPDAPMSSLEDAFAPADASNTPYISTMGLSYGAWRPAPDGSVIARTCPFALPPGKPNTWSEIGIVYYNHLHLQNVRKAWTEDYSDIVLQFFACAIGAPVDPDGTCSSTIAADIGTGSSLLGDDPAYRVFFHTGICHASREADGQSFQDGTGPDCDYDNMIQAPKSNQVYDENCKADGNQTCFRDWVRGWGQVPGFKWEDVK